MSLPVRLPAFALAAAWLSSSALAAVLEPYSVLVKSYPNPTSSVIQWDSDAPAVTAFKVERRLPGGQWAQVAYVGDATRSVNDAGLANSTLYEYRVLAFRSGGPAGGYPSATYNFAAPSTATSAAGYDLAAVPRNLDAQPMNSTDIYLSWTDVTSDETGFKIERRLPGGTWAPVITTQPDITRYRDQGLAANTTYEYRISALRPVGTAYTSGTVTAATAPSGVNKIFFVDGARGNDTWPGTESQPWATLKQAAFKLVPGQTVLVRWSATPYTRGDYYTIATISQKGDANNYTIFKAYPGERPRLKSTYGVNRHGIEIKDGQYVIVDGFEVAGFLQEVTETVADAENANAQAGGTISGIVDANGISVDGTTSHHVIVRNNLVHDHPGAGIAANGTDYVTIEYNRVYNTSWLSPYGTSGISYLTSKDFDANTSVYRQVIRGNAVSGVRNDYPCKCYGYQAKTDGNGIIIDTLRQGGYTGKTLIANNLVFQNGARGIHVLNAANVDVFNNTASNNGQVPETAQGEITVFGSDHVRAWNNILVARSDRPANGVAGTTAYPTSTNIDFSYNIVNGGNGYTATTGAVGNRLNTDPRFAQGSDIAAYALRGDSPAINTAGGGAPGAGSTDLFRAPRTRSSLTDVGAAESF